MSSIKPCPFCGSEAQMHFEQLCQDTIYMVKCSNDRCQCQEMGWHETEEDAIKVWNTRPTEDTLMTSLAGIQKKAMFHPFNIDNIYTYPPSCDMYLTVSIPNKGECYVEPDDRSVYDVMWWEAYAEEYWDKCNVTHWAYLPELPGETE